MSIFLFTQQPQLGATGSASLNDRLALQQKAAQERTEAQRAAKEQTEQAAFDQAKPGYEKLLSTFLFSGLDGKPFSYHDVLQVISALESPRGGDYAGLSKVAARFGVSDDEAKVNRLATALTKLDDAGLIGWSSDGKGHRSLNYRNYYLVDHGFRALATIPALAPEAIQPEPRQPLSFLKRLFS